MDDPDDLPRAVELSLFAPGAGRALDVGGYPPTRIPPSPPVGNTGEDVVIVHLAGYEDWRPRSPEGGSSSTSSETASSGPPAWIPFTWTPGAVDGQRPSAAGSLRPSAAGILRAAGCRPPVPPQNRRDRDPEDDNGGPRQGELRSCRVRQLFPGCSSGRSVRIRTQSPSSYQRSGNGAADAWARGRTLERSPPRATALREPV